MLSHIDKIAIFLLPCDARRWIAGGSARERRIFGFLHGHINGWIFIGYIRGNCTRNTYILVTSREANQSTRFSACLCCELFRTFLCKLIANYMAKSKFLRTELYVESAIITFTETGISGVVRFCNLSTFMVVRWFCWLLFSGFGHVKMSFSVWSWLMCNWLSECVSVSVSAAVILLTLYVDAADLFFHWARINLAHVTSSVRFP